MQDASRVRKEVWLEPPAGAGLEKKRKLPPNYFFEKIKNKRGRVGYLCSKSKTRDSPQTFNLTFEQFICNQTRTGCFQFLISTVSLKVK